MTVRPTVRCTRYRPIDSDGLVSSGSLQIGWLARSPGLLVARKLLLSKLLDVEFSIRGILRGFGLKREW